VRFLVSRGRGRGVRVGKADVALGETQIPTANGREETRMDPPPQGFPPSSQIRVSTLTFRMDYGGQAVWLVVSAFHLHAPTYLRKSAACSP
jgi:hypothetical protein